MCYPVVAALIAWQTWEFRSSRTKDRKEKEQNEQKQEYRTKHLSRASAACYMLPQDTEDQSDLSVQSALMYLNVMLAEHSRQTVPSSTFFMINQGPREHFSLTW